MKAYKTKNTHEARNEAIESGNGELAAIIWDAWEACDEVDPTAHWDEEDAAYIEETLREVGREELADRFVAAMSVVYG